MLKNIIVTVAVVSAIVITSCVAEAYPQNTLFGTGYGFAGYNNYSNGAAEANAVDQPKKDIVESTDSKINFSNGIRNVSDISGRHDEAPNAGYKTTYTYIEKDMSDYNPYTGADSGVNDSKSIYTDGLGRVHFFGKGSLFGRH